MLKNKLFGIIWIFIFALPKFFPTLASDEENQPDPPVIEPIPIRNIALETKPLRAINVDASVYFPVESQTDDTPLITADGSHIKKKKPSKHRWIAVSRNLLRRWGGPINYGDTLHVKGISDQLDGQYVVRDTMKKQIKDRIDILVGSEEKIMGYWENIRIYQLN